MVDDTKKGFMEGSWKHFLNIIPTIMVDDTKKGFMEGSWKHFLNIIPTIMVDDTKRVSWKVAGKNHFLADTHSGPILSGVIEKIVGTVYEF